MKLYSNKQGLDLCRGPLHNPLTINDQPPIELKNKDFSSIKMQSQHSDKVTAQWVPLQSELHYQKAN